MIGLILIDIQKGFDDYRYWSRRGQGTRNNIEMEANALKLLAHARKLGWQIFHVQHGSTEAGSPLNPDHLGFAFKEGFEPREGEHHFVKNVNSSFIGTSLEARLREVDVNRLVVCGISTEHCVSTTVRMAGNFGFEVMLAQDACHAWPHGKWSAEDIHDSQLAVLDGEFAKVVLTDFVFSIDA